MNVILSRNYRDKETTSCVYVFSGDQIVFNCKALELPNLGNQHNISCIPEGTYTVVKYSDVKHPNTFWVQNVPCRTGILIHIGNFVNGIKIDSEGCILPGTEFQDIDGNGSLDVVHPDVAMSALNQNLPSTFKLIIC